MHDAYTLDLLAGAMLDLVGMLNSPRQDDFLLREAGISLDRALFPLLVRIAAMDALSIVALAEQVARDHSTVSRQVAKLEKLRLITRQPGARDQRVREASISESGKAAVHAITAARRRVIEKLLGGWPAEERQLLAQLNRKFADAMLRARMEWEQDGAV